MMEQRITREKKIKECKSPWESGKAGDDESNCDPASAAMAPLL
jgi:hypothetical protein